jgi:hypothetical protein
MRYLQLRGHYLTSGTVEFWEHFLSPFSLVETKILNNTLAFDI